jgi:PQQ-dependent catabolism-associated CXXCW motif protein
MPAGLKMEHYRGPTPACVPNAVTLETADLQRLLAEQQSVLLDVFAILRRVDPGFGTTWLLSEPHESLPNSAWLPNVGYGTLEADIEAYFQRELQRLSDGDKAKPLVFFCVADCWMSWNAAQRAREYGYTQVYWYKLGVDGWKEAGLPVVNVTPTPL